VSRCDAEMCQHWTGHGCACEVFDIERPPRVCVECDGEIGEFEFWSLTPSGAVHLDGCPEEDEVAS
jgi:hypothetical protein